MSSPRFQIKRAPGSLKETEAALVKACGGLEKAAALTRVGDSQLQRYTAPGEPDCHMPADVVRSLEMHCGVPHVTSHLAMVTRHVLIDVSEGESAQAAGHLAKVGQETAELFKEFGTVIADGSISPREAGRLMQAVMRDMNALAALYGDLARLLPDGGA